MISLFFPAALDYFGEHAHIAEWTFWSLAALGGSFALWRVPVKLQLLIIFWGISAGALTAMLTHAHDIFHFLLATMAVYQVGVLIVYHASRRRNKLNCCDH